MISVQVDGEWIQTDSQSLIDLVVGDGRVNDCTPARDPAQGAGPRPLVELFASSEQEQLMTRLLRMLPGLYFVGPGSTDLTMLLERVRSLRDWNWADALIRSRLEWLAAWLEELAGSHEAAIVSYSVYLAERSQEPHLSVLARSNRGILRVRLGRQAAEGVMDIAAAAIPADADLEGVVSSMRLPAACFSLLSLLHRAFGRRPLHDQLEAVLVDYMAGLPRRIRERCLGPDPVIEDDDPRGQTPRSARDATDDGQDVEDGETVDDDSTSARESARRALEHERLQQRLKILNDRTFKRLNRLIVYLADEAVKIAGPSEGRCSRDTVAAQLCLWPAEAASDVAGAASLASRVEKQHHEQCPLDTCTEAASLLYASGIPMSLASTDGPVSTARRCARVVVQQAEAYRSSGQYEMAEHLLGGLFETLDRSGSDPSVQPLREAVSQRLDEVRRQVRDFEQRNFQETCVDLRRQVGAFCNGKELCQAESESEDLLHRIREALAEAAAMSAPDGGLMAMLGDLPGEIQRHLAGLRRADVERRIAEPLKQLRDYCPRHWQQPVHPAAYEALRKCRINDPAGLIEDWDAWWSRLERHQGQYYLRQVLKEVTEGRINTDGVEQKLARVIEHDPSLSPACAPLYCLLALDKMPVPSEGFIQSRDEVLDVAKRLLQSEPLGRGSLWNPAARAGLVQEACVLLRRLIRSSCGMGAELDTLWQALAASFAPAFEESPPAVLREIRAVVSTCLEACPVHHAGRISWLDPRNRLHVLQQVCDRAIMVAEGEALLHEGRGHEAQACFEKAIDALAGEGLANDTDMQSFRRAVSGLCLTLFQQGDTAQARRSALDRVDEWMAEISRGDHRIDCSLNQVRERIADFLRPVEPPPAASQENGGEDAPAEPGT